MRIPQEMTLFLEDKSLLGPITIIRASVQKKINIPQQGPEVYHNVFKSVACKLGIVVLCEAFS